MSFLMPPVSMLREVRLNAGSSNWLIAQYILTKQKNNDFINSPTQEMIQVDDSLRLTTGAYVP